MRDLIENLLHLHEVLTKEEENRIRSELAVPEILPCTFDVTVPGWFARIELWGRIEIIHRDPETFRGKRKVTRKQFIDRISNDEITRMLGRWEIKKNNTTSVTFYRGYIGIDGRKYTEEFIISVRLRKELR